MAFSGLVRIVSRRLFIILAVLGPMGCSVFKTEIRTSTRIDAPREVVWRILADFERYPEWNPYHVKVVPLEEKSLDDVSEGGSACGTIRKGEKLKVFIHKPNDKKVDLEVKVLELEAPSKLYWGGGIPGIFTGEHRFILEEVGSTSTVLRHDEYFQGAVLPFVPLEPEYIEQGYNQMNQAAKERAETVYGDKDGPPK